MERSQPIMIGLNAVIVAVTEESPRVLTVKDAEHSLSAQKGLTALPFGPLDADKDRTLEKGVRGWVREQTGLKLGYVEQLYTFGDQHRDPIEREGGPRVLSIAYLALVREGRLAGDSRADWKDYYAFLPWEDWRAGRPEIIKHSIVPGLESWIEQASDSFSRAARRDRAAIAFGLGSSGWDGERVLERYELLYEIGLVRESARDQEMASKGEAGSSGFPHSLGLRMALDHRRMLSTALGRIRGKIRYRPVVFELLPSTFTLFQLQRVVEALAGVRLHKQNFRRLVDKGGLVEGTGQIEKETGGRPAELFRFRRDVLRERRAPGVGIPGV